MTSQKKYDNLNIDVTEKRINIFYDKRGDNEMLNDEICKLRDELNKSIEENKDYSIIYDLSVKLDELIAKYYKLGTG